jgi:hypothetical protein
MLVAIAVQDGIVCFDAELSSAKVIGQTDPIWFAAGRRGETNTNVQWTRLAAWRIVLSGVQEGGPHGTSSRVRG